MRILIVNKFLYPRGGDCIAAMTAKQILERHGHTVRGYAMSYPLNTPSPNCNDYASEVTFSGGLTQKLTAAKRMLGYGDIKESAKNILDEFKPDIVHLHNIHSYLSPIMGELAHKRGIKVVWTLHDYKLLCPSYACLQPTGIICQECFTGNLKVIDHRCMKGSLVASILAHIEAKTWNRRRLSNFTSRFIAPSKFMREKMIEGGFDGDKTAVLSNAIAPERARLIAERPFQDKREDIFCYVGRLSKEKGVETLLAAAALTGIQLRIAGDGPLKESLQQKYKSSSNIKFLGQLDGMGVIDILSKAKCSIIPSEWYENNPIGVIESLCCGTPVIGANIGGIPELITETNGSVYLSGSITGLASALTAFDESKFNNRQIAGQANTIFNEETHYNKLMEIYTN